MNWKNRLWQFFLAIVVGATLSVCNSAMDTNNFEAIAGSVSSGSNWVRIGNIQIVSGTTSNVSSIDIGKPFKDGTKVYQQYNCYTSNTGSSSSGFTSISGTTWSISCGNNLVYYLIGTWQ